jgi:hypothetical protein
MEAPTWVVLEFQEVRSTQILWSLCGVVGFCREATLKTSHSKVNAILIGPTHSESGVHCPSESGCGAALDLVSIVHSEGTTVCSLLALRRSRIYALALSFTGSFALGYAWGEASNHVSFA